MKYLLILLLCGTLYSNESQYCENNDIPIQYRTTQAQLEQRYKNCNRIAMRAWARYDCAQKIYLIRGWKGDGPKANVAWRRYARYALRAYLAGIDAEHIH